MALESTYYISQIVSVILIIGSLLFFGFQFRQTRLMERAAAQRDLLNRVSDWSRLLPNMDDSTALCFFDYQGADGRSQSYFETAIGEFVFITESALNMHRDGFFTEGTWGGIEGAALAMIRTPGGAQWWTYGKNYIGREIVEHLETRLNEIDPKAPTFIDFTPSLQKRLEEITAARSPRTPSP